MVAVARVDLIPPIFRSDDERWEAVKTRNKAADGAFYYSVRSTGVYCRPSCPGRLPRRENVQFYATCGEAEAAGFRACKRCRPSKSGRNMVPMAEPTIAERVTALDWTAIEAELNAHGCATTGPLLPASECGSLVQAYGSDDRFRSRVVMARHGFGKGEYKYFRYPLPGIVAALRAALYPPLAEIANRWMQASGIDRRYPREHAAYVAQCHAAGQPKPTPLLLQYRAGDYNCLHQDIYGDLVFPMQATVLLSEPGADFCGGEFVLTEQRPRMQSRIEVVPLRRGELVIFPVHHRPMQGTRGTYRVTMRHGVSRLRSGTRHTLGIIFHDAA